MGNEFSRIFDLSALKKDAAETRVIQPKPAEYPNLIKRLDIIGLKNMKAEVTVSKDGKYVDVRGKVSATVVQPCVITLEPVETQIEEVFETVLEEGFPKKSKKNAEIEMPEQVQEYFEGHKIDIGEIVTQQLVLALPVYPRKKSAKL